MNDENAPQIDVGRAMEDAIVKHVIPAMTEIKNKLDELGNEVVDPQSFVASGQADREISTAQTNEIMRNLSDEIRLLRESIGGLQVVLATRI